jgi:hypothetical protein
MRNAKEEFIKEIEGKIVLAAFIQIGNSYNEDDDTPKYYLKKGFSNEEFLLFIESLDFNYDSGYGGQELFGTIWYKDGTWSSRGEYDGYERWEYNVCPELPKSLLKTAKQKKPPKIAA